MLSLDMALKIINVAGTVIKEGGALAQKFREVGAKEGVTEADWDALEAQLDRIEARARREMGQE